jgi:hypothetical protein
MKKNELSIEQRYTHKIIFQKLISSGWKDVIPEFNTNEDLWFNKEIGMIYANEATQLDFEYSFKNKLAFFIIWKNTGERIYLIIETNDKIEDFVDWLIINQNKITPSNYKGPIRELLDIFSNIWAVMDDDTEVLLTAS